MSKITSTEPAADETRVACIIDPGGEDRANAPVTDADHTPADDPDGLDRVMAPVADAVLVAAALQPGEAVLDIGCGCGATTCLAADAVGPRGSVCGIDVTAAMLDVARSRRDSSGLTTIEFVEADAQTYPFAGSFDVAISRFGTMFFDDPAAAFANVANALRPGGRLCVATWQPLESNEWLVIPGAALLHWITLPDLSGGGPGMFAQSDPDIVTGILESAGYTGIGVKPVRVELPLGADPDEALDRLADTGVGRAALDAVPADQLPAARAAVRDVVAGYAGADGIRMDAAVLITSASAPS
ncbi:MAG: class I SAM-dependent methyltransferase [Acidimicrobiia bacterium]